MTTVLTQTENKTTIFKNLYAAIIDEQQKEFSKFEVELLNAESLESILSSWYYLELLPAGKKKAKWEIKTLIPYLIERKHKQVEKSIAKKLEHLQTVEKAGELESINVSVEWVKSRMWGNNAKANARICDKQYGHNYESERTSGCGYDKESTAIAEAINQSNEFLKAMYLHKEKNINVGNRELFGYGSGYGILPRLEGGVGVSCYPRIFETIGFKWANVASGKTFDVYSVNPK